MFNLTAAQSFSVKGLKMVYGPKLVAHNHCNNNIIWCFTPL